MILRLIFSPQPPSLTSDFVGGCAYHRNHIRGMPIGTSLWRGEYMVASQSCAWVNADLSTVTGVSTPASSGSGDVGEWSVYARVIHDGRANLAYREYQSVYALYEATTAELVGRHHDSPRGGVADQFVVTATRLSVTFAVSSFTASRLLGESIAAHVRTPKTALLLRDAVISPEVFRQIVLRTDCVLDPDLLARIDTEIAAELRRLGSVSRGRAKAVADRMVARHDPEGVQERRTQAREARCVYTTNTEDGMAELTVIADAENARLALLALDVVIGGVCPKDPRSKGQLRSDAAIARLRGEPFTCGCGDEASCSASLAESDISDRQARIVLHAICRKETLDGSSLPGVLDGYGVISADHVRALAARADTTVRSLDLDDLVDETPTEPAAQDDSACAAAACADAADGAATQDDSTDTNDARDEATDHGTTDDENAAGEQNPAASKAPGTRPRRLLRVPSRPADPYRLTTALDAIVRFLHGACTVPGCDQPAWMCDLDHAEE
ncbi:MAG: DUF222 domain-containing protein, partial [Gordonia sp. (in: high G+C Gram-positive bacteria)]